jgi:hypothetical protein
MASVVASLEVLSPVSTADGNVVGPVMANCLV